MTPPIMGTMVAELWWPVVVVHDSPVNAVSVSRDSDDDKEVMPKTTFDGVIAGLAVDEVPPPVLESKDSVSKDLFAVEPT